MGPRGRAAVSGLEDAVTHSRSENNLIQTFTGRAVDPLNITAGDVCIEDIAHALANICRFGGHTREFYSVAQHSVLAAEYISMFLAPPTSTAKRTVQARLHALLHDAPEAYLGDHTRPIKARLLVQVGSGMMSLPIREIENYNWWEIRRALLGVSEIMPTWLANAVAEVDLALLRTEAEQLMRFSDEVWQSVRGIEPLPIVIEPAQPREAEAMFLAKWEELRGERGGGA